MQPIPKLIILGRDGILNEFREDHIKAPEEWVAVPGALEAVSRLNHAGWHVVVATNQSGIGRGMIDMATVNAVHAHMMRQLQQLGGRIDAVFFCPHTPEDGCACRKPLPGMLHDIAQRYGVDLATVPMVGRHAARPAGRAGGGLRAAPGAHRPRSGAGRRTDAWRRTCVQQVPGDLRAPVRPGAHWPRTCCERDHVSDSQARGALDS